MNAKKKTDEKIKDLFRSHWGNRIALRMNNNSGDISKKEDAVKEFQKQLYDLPEKAKEELNIKEKDLKRISNRIWSNKRIVSHFADLADHVNKKQSKYRKKKSKRRR